jgi:hypothetical protein
VLNGRFSLGKRLCGPEMGTEGAKKVFLAGTDTQQFHLADGEIIPKFQIISAAFQLFQDFGKEDFTVGDNAIGDELFKVFGGPTCTTLTKCVLFYSVLDRIAV